MSLYLARADRVVIGADLSRSSLLLAAGQRAQQRRRAGGCGGRTRFPPRRAEADHTGEMGWIAPPPRRRHG
jgi:hypothetical protein